MGFIADFLAGVGGAAGQLFNTGYNIWSNQRDFDYQKSLQNEIFAREDNAVQRRVKDLEAAGLNVNLAAGSAAGTGSVVGRSNTNQLSGNPVGTALDMASHVAQLRNIRLENQILQNQKSKTEAEARVANNEALMDNIELNTMLGLKSGVTYDSNGNLMAIHKGFDGERWLKNDNSPIMNLLRWQYDNNKNSAWLLQKDVDTYDTDRFFRYLGNSASALSNFGNFGKSLPRMRR